MKQKHDRIVNYFCGQFLSEKKFTRREKKQKKIMYAWDDLPLFKVKNLARKVLKNFLYYDTFHRKKKENIKKSVYNKKVVVLSLITIQSHWFPLGFT